MKDFLFLSWQYMKWHRWQTIMLFLGVFFIFFLPISLSRVIDVFEERLLERAKTTPLVLGREGSRFDLTVSALYFQSKNLSTFPVSFASEITNTEYGTAVPVMLRSQARGFPIVGTSLEYFELRSLQIAEGQPLGLIGDCVLGAEVAKALGLKPSDRLMSDPDNVFNLAGTYPLNMLVTGILQATGTADDWAVFVDLKTSWVIQDIGHGHQEVNQQSADSVVLEKKEGNVTANAALQQYNEITPQNIDSFHFHGNPDSLPITSVLIFPFDAKSGTLLRGRYQQTESMVMLQPVEIIRDMFELVFKVKTVFDANSILVSLATFLFLILIVLLSLRLRSKERETMFRMGSSKWTIFAIMSLELVLVIVPALVLSQLLAALISNQIAIHLLDWVSV